MKRLPFVLLALVAVAALVVPSVPTATQAGVAAPGPINSGDTAWMLTAAALVLLMTPGLSFFYGGMVSFKNVVSTMLQSVVALGIISILWVVVGFSLAFGDSFHGLIGNPLTYLFFDGVNGATNAALSPTVPLLVFAMFQLKFAIITPALITGSFAERVNFKGYVLFITLWSLLIYSPLAHWTWHPNGFLHQLGVLDFAGGTVVHMSAGFAALAGAMILGRRTSHEAQEPHTPANVPFVLLGTGLLWFGWFGFNAGSALAANDSAALAFATTNTASAAAMLSWMFFDVMRGNKPSAVGACVGAVVGLVAITPAAGFVSVRHSIIIGVVAAVVSNLAVHLRTKSSLDDTLDVFPCHGVGGLVGMIATGVFAKDVGLIHGNPKTFLMHLVAIVIVGAFTFVGSYILYKFVDAITPMRVARTDEEVGLDLSQHGEIAAVATSGRAKNVPIWGLEKTA